MPTNNGTLSLEEQLKQGMISPGTPFPIRQHVELSFSDDTIEKLKESNQSFKLTESEGGTTERKLLVTVEGIHTGMTKNKTFYPGNTLNESIPSWTTPHYKPVLKNHNEYSEPLGRIVHSEYVESTLTDKYTVRLKLEITDADAIEKVIDGRYLTLSVGGSANKVVCSVCAKDLVTEGYCGHMRGRKYEGKEAYWTIAQYTGDEISFVNMPADVHAQVISAELITAKGGSKVKDGTTKEGAQATDGQAGIQTQESNADGASLIDDLLGNEEPINTQENSQDNEDPKDNENEPGAVNENNDNSDTPDDPEGGDEPNPENPTESEQIVKLKADLQAANERIGELEESLQEKEADNLVLIAERDSAKSDLTNVQKQLEAAEDDNKTRTNQNIELARFARKAMAERVADLRILQGKDAMDKREELVSEWNKSSVKVLQSTIGDLLESGRRHIETVVSPALALGEKNAPIVNEDDEPIVPKKPKEAAALPTMGDFESNIHKSMFRTTSV